MSFLLNLFSRTSASSARDTVQKRLRLMRIDSPQPLPDAYYEILFSPQSNTHPRQKNYPREEILSEVILSLGSAATEAAIIKIYTIVMCAVRMSDYDSECCEALEKLQQVSTAQFMSQKPERLIQIQRCCRSYLAKLSSMSQLYQSALSSRQSPSEDSHVVLYRMMNQFSLLFPLMNNALNTVGRYFKETLLYYKQFYRVWRSEVLLGYLSLKRSVDDFLLNFKSKDMELLECFMESVPQIELLCDQMESMITNKYYKGKIPNKKVYFSEEMLQEMEYYRLGMKNSGKIEEDFIRTADDDFFAFQK